MEVKGRGGGPSPWYSNPGTTTPLPGTLNPLYYNPSHGYSNPHAPGGLSTWERGVRVPGRGGLEYLERGV